jgi:hypothetical protein
MAWMDSVHPDVLTRWIAYCRVEPFGREWHRTAGVSHQISLLRRELAFSRSPEAADSLKSQTEFAYHMPGEWSDPRPRTRLSIEDHKLAAQATAAAFDPRNRR